MKHTISGDAVTDTFLHRIHWGIYISCRAVLQHWCKKVQGRFGFIRRIYLQLRIACIVDCISPMLYSRPPMQFSKSPMQFSTAPRRFSTPPIQPSKSPTRTCTASIPPFCSSWRDNIWAIWCPIVESVMDIGYFSYFLSLYLPDKETQRNTYLNPCSEFILNFLDIIYSQMTPIRKQSFLLKLEPLLEPLPFRLCLIQ